MWCPSEATRLGKLTALALVLVMLSPMVAVADDDDDDEEEQQDPRLAAIQLEGYKKDGNIFTGLSAEVARTYHGVSKDKLFKACLKVYLEEGHTLASKDAELGLISGTGPSGYTLNVFVEEAGKDLRVKMKVAFKGGSVPFTLEEWFKSFYLQVDDIVKGPPK